SQSGVGGQGVDQPRHRAGGAGTLVDACGGGAARARGARRARGREPAALPGAGPVGVLGRFWGAPILCLVLVGMGVFLMLGGLWVLIDQQDDIGTGRYTAWSALWYTLLNLPQQAYELLPITVLIGALLGLGSLARGSELTVVRATGVS